ncbi:MAG TPA: hypothetical protein VIV34_07530 [Pseudolabrys sp.]
MRVLRCGVCATVGIWVLCSAGVAGAQENLDQGKTPAQLFAANCAICHKSPQGLAKAGGLLGLDSFLREHYTASKESASALAAYLKAMDTAAPARAGRRAAKGDEKKKPGTKAGEQKGPEKMPEAKAVEPKSSESKPSEPKPAEILAPEPKSGDAKPPAAGDAKPTEGGKSEKSD